MGGSYKGFLVELYNTNGGAVDNSLASLRVLFYSRHAVGGPLRAEIAVDGADSALWDALNWLGYKVIVRNRNGTCVWSGVVSEASVTHGAARVGLSLERMANRVRIIYNVERPDGTSEQKYTDWAEDAESVRRYGIKEKTISLTDATDQGAIAKRDTALATRKHPQPVVTFDGDGQAGATLVCIGRFSLLSWYNYSDLSGKEAYEANGGVDHAIGWQVTGSNIGFRYGAIHDFTGQFRAFKPDNQVRVSGSSANNGLYVVTEVEDKAPISYVASTIGFETGDDILDSAGGLGVFENEQMINVSGSDNAANNGVRWVKTTGTTRIEATGMSGNIVNDSADDPITIVGGRKMSFDEEVNGEAPGSSITVTAVGLHVGQRFTPSLGTWTVHEVCVRAARVGSPSDQLAISLYTDNAGVPGTLLSYGYVAGSTMSADSDWVSAALVSGVQVTAGTYYHVAVFRSGSMSGTDYYTLGLNTDANSAYTGGQVKLWDSVAGVWTNRYEAAYMPFQLWGKVDTAVQIRDMLEGSPWFTGAQYEALSGVLERQWRIGDQPTLDELTKLVEMGTATGKKVFISVDENAVAYIYPEPDPSISNPVMRLDGTIVNPFSGQWEHGVLPAGSYVYMMDVPAHVGYGERINPVLIQEAEYDVENDRIRLTPWGQEDDEFD